MVSLSTEQVELIANLSLPVPNSIVIQVFFFGVPNINKSCSAVISETVSIGYSEGITSNFPLVPSSFLLVLFLMLSNCSVFMSFSTTCSRVNSEL